MRPPLFSFEDADGALGKLMLARSRELYRGAGDRSLLKRAIELAFGKFDDLLLRRHAMIVVDLRAPVCARKIIEDCAGRSDA